VSLRIRLAVLAILCLATLGFVAVILLHGPAPDLPQIASRHAVTFLLVFALALVQLRHAVLAALVALGPMLALPWLGAIAPLWPGPAASNSLGLAFGYAIAAFVAEAAVANILGERAEEAALGRMETSWAASLVCLAGFLAAGVGLGVATFWQGAWFALEAVWASAAAVTVILLAAPLVPRSEDFIARWNRRHEFESRLFSELAAVAAPRWGRSAAGIALVMAAIAFFGARPQLSGFVWAGSFALLFVAALAGARLWRAALGAATALVIAMMVAFWVGRAAGTMDWIPFSVIPLFCTTGFARKLGRLQETDPSEAGLGAVYGELAGRVVFAILAAAVSLAGLMSMWGAQWLAAEMVILAGGTAVLVVQPAFTAIFISLLPRRRSVEELYRTS